jgi:hypothetical protein
MLMLQVSRDKTGSAMEANRSLFEKRPLSRILRIHAVSDSSRPVVCEHRFFSRGHEIRPFLKRKSRAHLSLPQSVLFFFVLSTDAWCDNLTGFESEDTP